MILSRARPVSPLAIDKELLEVFRVLRQNGSPGFALWIELPSGNRPPRAERRLFTRRGSINDRRPLTPRIRGSEGDRRLEIVITASNHHHDRSRAPRILSFEILDSGAGPLEGSKRSVSRSVCRIVALRGHIEVGREQGRAAHHRSAGKQKNSFHKPVR